jgi:amidase
VVSRSVRDSAALLDCTAGYSVGDPHVAPLPARPFRAEVGADPGRLRIGVALSQAGGVRFHPDCAEAAKRTATLLADLGHEVEEVSPTYDWALLGEAIMVFFAASVGRAIEDHAAETGRTPSVDNVERNNLWLWQQARQTNAVEYLRAVRRLNTVTRQFAAFFVDRDIWLTPTMASPPPALGHLHADVEDVPEFFRRLWTFNPLNTIYNASGQPAISLPLHWNADGLPIGLMFGAAFGAEDVLFRLSAQLEAAQPWHGRHPPVSVWNL